MNSSHLLWIVLAVLMTMAVIGVVVFWMTTAGWGSFLLAVGACLVWAVTTYKTRQTY